MLPLILGWTLASDGTASAQMDGTPPEHSAPSMSLLDGDAVGRLITLRRQSVSRRDGSAEVGWSADGELAGGGAVEGVRGASGGSIGSSPGAALLSSAILPGSGQILHGRVGRGIVYAAIEAATIALYADQTRKARDKEQRYERFANGNWSVVNYAVWLVGYHDMHELSNPYIGQLRQITDGLQPAYDIGVDWPRIPIELLRNVERNTLYVYRLSRGQNTFSHVMPDYGSQQYYELISKYYQYGPGWSDFPADKFVLPWDGSEMSAQFYQGRDQAEAFNDHYRLASNMVSLLIVNHLFSAFDAYFTVKLDTSHLSALPPVSTEQAVRLRWAF